ncbi:MAG: hypothetical protein R3A10_20900 [Caldilineaceae bacterium]
MSTLASTSPAAARPRIPRRLRYLYAAFGLLLLWLVLWLAPVDVRTFPATWNIGLDDAIGRMQSWVIGARNVNPFFVYVIDPDSGRHRRPAARSGKSAGPRAVARGAHRSLCRRVSAAGRRAAIVATAGVFVMGLLGLWTATMQTLALMGVAVAIALVLGIPLGILTAQSDGLQRVIPPGAGRHADHARLRLPHPGGALLRRGACPQSSPRSSTRCRRPCA